MAKKPRCGLFIDMSNKNTYIPKKENLMFDKSHRPLFSNMLTKNQSETQLQKQTSVDLEEQFPNIFNV